MITDTQTTTMGETTMYDKKLDDSAHIEFGRCLIQSMQHDHSPVRLYDDDGNTWDAPLKRAVMMRAIAIMPDRTLQTYIMSSYVLADEITNESIFNCFDGVPAKYGEWDIDACYAHHIALVGCDHRHNARLAE